ncbi:MAG: 3-dehydroquinate synthase [Acidobacteriota bacterium]|nr:3-dehydroquinate synthase [Acidobacteriota bacterium]
MPAFEVQTAHNAYLSVVERGVVRRASEFLPQRAGKLFVITTEDVWALHGRTLDSQISERAQPLFFPGGEPNKRLSSVEAIADQMLEHGADRTSVVIGFGGGIVTDVSGFVAAIFMRGIPVLQIPTTLLAQVDAAVGGKTGVNLVGGKNLIGSFHQPLAVLIDPDVLQTLSEREYRAGLFEVIKCAIIRDPELYQQLKTQSDAVLARDPDVVDQLIAAAVRIKAEVVSADEREGDLRRILNFGHTIGHAIEAETKYNRFLHGEAVAWGMLSAIRLAELTGDLSAFDAASMREMIESYGSLPLAADLDADHLLARLSSDKKTLQGKVHFVLPVTVGRVRISSGIEPALVRRAMVESLNPAVSVSR